MIRLKILAEQGHDLQERQRWDGTGTKHRGVSRFGNRRLRAPSKKSQPEMAEGVSVDQSGSMSATCNWALQAQLGISMSQLSG